MIVTGRLDVILSYILFSAMLAVVKSAIDLFCAGLLVRMIVFHQNIILPDIALFLVKIK